MESLLSLGMQKELFYVNVYADQVHVQDEITINEPAPAGYDRDDLPVMSRMVDE